MKTKSLLIAMAGMLAASCAQNEIMELNPEVDPSVAREIKLDVYTGVQTRGSETTSTTLKAEDAGFGILAYETSQAWTSAKTSATPNFMYNEHATWVADATEPTKGAWTYESSPRFWPTDNEKISFFAYAPYETVPAQGTNKGIVLSGKEDQGAPTISFTTKDNFAEMVDLVVSEAITDKPDVNKKNEAVTFKFSHVLTKIADIRVVPSVDLNGKSKILLKSIKIKQTSGKELYKKALYQFEEGKWNYEEGNTTKYGDANNLDIDLTSILTEAKEVEFGGKKYEGVIDVSAYPDATTTPTTEATSIFKKDHSLYFIPAKEAGTNEGEFKFELVYTLANDNGFSHEITTEASLPSNSFAKGTSYIYTIKVNMNAITIDVEEDNTFGWTSSDNNTLEA